MSRPVLLLLIGGIVLLYLYHYSGGARAWLRGLALWFAGSPESRGNNHKALPRDREDPQAQAELERYERFVQEVSALSWEEAKRRAEPILCDGNLWRAAGRPPEDPDRLRILGPTLRELFARGARVEALYGEVNLNREEIAPALPPVADALPFKTAETPIKRTFYRVGMDMDGNPAVVERGQDMIYIVHRASGMDGKSWTTTYPSVYHWLLIKHFAMHQRTDHDA
jgi:hypothetical protein